MSPRWHARGGRAALRWPGRQGRHDDGPGWPARRGDRPSSPCPRPLHPDGDPGAERRPRQVRAHGRPAVVLTDGAITRLTSRIRAPRPCPAQGRRIGGSPTRRLFRPARRQVSGATLCDGPTVPNVGTRRRERRRPPRASPGPVGSRRASTRCAKPDHPMATWPPRSRPSPSGHRRHRADRQQRAGQGRRGHPGWNADPRARPRDRLDHHVRIDVRDAGRWRHHGQGSHPPREGSIRRHLAWHRHAASTTSSKASGCPSMKLQGDGTYDWVVRSATAGPDVPADRIIVNMDSGPIAENPDGFVVDMCSVPDRGRHEHVGERLLHRPSSRIQARKDSRSASWTPKGRDGRLDRGRPDRDDGVDRRLHPAAPRGLPCRDHVPTGCGRDRHDPGPATPAPPNATATPPGGDASADPSAKPTDRPPRSPRARTAPFPPQPERSSAPTSPTVSRATSACWPASSRPPRPRRGRPAAPRARALVHPEGCPGQSAGLRQRAGSIPA